MARIKTKTIEKKTYVDSCACPFCDIRIFAGYFGPYHLNPHLKKFRMESHMNKRRKLTEMRYFWTFEK